MNWKKREFHSSLPSQNVKAFRFSRPREIIKMKMAMSSQTYQIDTVVDALPAWAQGTFAGGATGGTAVSAVQNGRDATPARASPSATRYARGIRSPSGVVSLTIAANGKISGKALGDGKTWTLSAPWFDEARLLDDYPLEEIFGWGIRGRLAPPGSGIRKSEVGSLAFHATVISKSGKEVATNAVTVAADAARPESAPCQCGVATGTSRLFNLSTLQLP